MILKGVPGKPNRQRDVHSQQRGRAGHTHAGQI